MRSFTCRVIAILRNAASNLTLKDVTRKCSVPSTHVYSGKQIDKIALGKIERSVQVLLYFHHKTITNYEIIILCLALFLLTSWGWSLGCRSSFKKAGKWRHCQ